MTASRNGPPEDGWRDAASDPEVVRLSRFERKFAARNLETLRLRFAKANSNDSSEDVQAKSLRLTYYFVSRRWIGNAMPLGLAAGCMWSFPDSPLQIGIAGVLTGITLVPVSFCAIRWKQAKRYWPEVVRPPKSVGSM